MAQLYLAHIIIIWSRIYWKQHIKEKYTKVDNGESLTAPVLNKLMRNVYEQFFGDAVELTDGMELTMRQPHYYMGLYSYTYSAGLTIGTVVSQKLKEGQKQSMHG